MAQLRRALGAKTQEPGNEAMPVRTPGSSPMMPEVPAPMMGPQSMAPNSDPYVQRPGPAPPIEVPPMGVPGEQGGGGGTTTRSREGAVGSGQAGGAGSQSIVSRRQVAPTGGGLVGMTAQPDNMFSGPGMGAPSLIPPSMAFMTRPDAVLDLFGGQGGRSNLFGRAGGLQGGGLGVPGGGGATTGPSSLIEALLKALGGR